MTTPTRTRAAASLPPGSTPTSRRAPRIKTFRPWMLLAPALVILAVLMLWPLARVFDLSFQDYGLRELTRGESNYIGLGNYSEVVSSSYLWTVVLPNTVGFAVTCVVLTVALGTVVALLLNRLGTVWRVVCLASIMVAWAVPAITSTYVWVFLFDPQYGLVAETLGSMGLIEVGAVNWFTARLGFYAIAALNIVHHGFPFIAVTILAGLLTVPKELYEAAELDGAGAWRRFWKITVPVLKPVFAVVTILSTIWDFKVFTQIYLMPGGNGGNAEVFNLGVWSYVQSFGQGRYGLGSAIAVLLTLVLLVITVVYMRTLFKEDEL